MIVDIGDEQDADGAGLLRRQHLAERHGGFGGDHAVERARRVALARLVVEHQHDLALQRVAGVVVVRQARRGDAEAGKHQPALHAAAGAEAMRIVILSSLQLQRDAAVHDLAAYSPRRASPPSG